MSFTTKENEIGANYRARIDILFYKHFPTNRIPTSRHRISRHPMVKEVEKIGSAQPLTPKQCLPSPPTAKPSTQSGTIGTKHSSHLYN